MRARAIADAMTAAGRRVRFRARATRGERPHTVGHADVTVGGDEHGQGGVSGLGGDGLGGERDRGRDEAGQEESPAVEVARDVRALEVREQDLRRHVVLLWWRCEQVRERKGEWGAGRGCLCHSDPGPRLPPAPPVAGREVVPVRLRARARRPASRDGRDRRPPPPGCEAPAAGLPSAPPPPTPPFPSLSPCVFSLLHLLFVLPFSSLAARLHLRILAAPRRFLARPGNF